MTLLGILHSLFGVGGVPEKEIDEARQSWRSAIHSSRNEAQKAIGEARRSDQVSKWATQRLDDAAKVQEQVVIRTTEQNLLNRLNELDRRNAS